MYATRSRRVKRDKRDARTLAEAASWGRKIRLIALQMAADVCVPSRACEKRWCALARYLSLMRALVRREGFRVGSGSAEVRRSSRGG